MPLSKRLKKKYMKLAIQLGIAACLTQETCNPAIAWTALHNISTENSLAQKVLTFMDLECDTADFLAYYAGVKKGLHEATKDLGRS